MRPDVVDGESFQGSSTMCCQPGDFFDGLEVPHSSQGVQEMARLRICAEVPHDVCNEFVANVICALSLRGAAGIGFGQSQLGTRLMAVDWQGA